MRVFNFFFVHHFISLWNAYIFVKLVEIIQNIQFQLHAFFFFFGIVFNRISGELYNANTLVSNSNKIKIKHEIRCFHTINIPIYLYLYAVQKWRFIFRMTLMKRINGVRNKEMCNSFTWHCQRNSVEFVKLKGSLTTDKFYKWPNIVLSFCYQTYNSDDGISILCVCYNNNLVILFISL